MVKIDAVMLIPMQMWLQRGGSSKIFGPDNLAAYDKNIQYFGILVTWPQQEKLVNWTTGYVNI